MKSRRFLFGTFVLPLASVVVFSGSVQAATRIKNSTANSIDLAGSWDTLPTSGDVGQWNSTATATGDTVTVGAGLSIGGIQITNVVGGVTINAGTGNLTIGSSGIDMTTAAQNLTINAPLVVGASQQWNVATGRTLTIGGLTGMAMGANNVTLNGLGSVTFTPGATLVTPTGTGTLTVNGGFLNINNGGVTTSLTNAISGTTVLGLGGGTTTIQVNASSGTFTQNFASTTLSGGGSLLQGSRGSSSQWVTNLGTITRSVGSTLQLNSSNSTTSGYKIGTGTNGIVGGWAVTNGTDFTKFTNATTIIGSTNFAPTYTANTWASTNNTSVGQTATSVPASSTTNSLLFSQVASDTLTLSGTNIISTGGILNTTAVTSAFTNTITGGTLKGSASDLIVNQYGAGSLAINSIIANNGAGSALTVAGTGAGAVILGGANTFTGGVFINNSAILQMASGGTLNSNALTFNNNSSGKFQLSGISTTLGGLNTSTVLAAAVPIVENANASGATLTINNASANAYAGTLQNGTGGGALALTKTGVGTLTLSGANTATGAVSITGGTLALTGSTALGAATISIGSSGTLSVSGRTGGSLALTGSQVVSGLGTVTGGLTTASGTTFNPGGSGTIGALSIGSLSASTGSIFNFELPNSGLTSDQLTISTSGGLVLAGTGITVNFSPTSGGTFAGGIGNTYNLFSYSGALSGAGTSGGNLLGSTFTVGNAVGGLTYSFANTGSFITVTIGGSLAVDATWQVGGVDTSWNTTGNWAGGVVPQNSGDTARFGSAIGATPTTVTLDGNKSAAVVEFSNSGAAYTIAQGSSGTLTMDNGVSNAQVNSTAGSHTISAPMSLASNTSFGVTGSGDTLTVSGAVGGAGTLIKTGAGTLALTTTNNFTGGVTLNAGTLSAAAGALGTTGAISFGGGTLKYASGNTDDISGRTVTFVSQATIDTNGNNVTFANAVGNSGVGGLTKQGAGTLALAAGNTYTGASIISGGTLKIAADTSLGAVPGSATTNLTINGGTTLQFGASITLSANRSIVFGSGTGTIDTNGFGAVILGATSGAGLIDKIGVGTLAMTGTSTGNGGLTVDAGTVAVNSNANLPTGTITLNGTAGITTTTTTSLFSNPVVVNGTNFITSTTGSTVQTLGAVTGNGTLTFGGNYVNDYGGSLTGFTGTLIASGGGSRWNGSTGGTNLTLNLANTGTSVRSNATGITIGALAGTSTAILGGSGGGATQNVVYTIGGKTVGGLGVTPVDSNYDGFITNGTGTTGITKVGNSTLTLTNSGTASNYTGLTTVSAGILNIRANSALGSTTGATTVSNGATLQLQGNISVGAEALSLNGGAASGQTGALVNVSGTNTYAGAVTVTASSSISALSGSTLNLTGGVVKSGTTATFTGGGNINVSGVAISGAAASSDLVVTGAGTNLTISVASSYNGPTTIQSSGTITAGVVNSLPTTTTLTVNTSGTFDLAGFNQSLVSLTGDATGTVKNSVVSTTSTLTFSSGSATNFAGSIAGNNGGTQGDVALAKSGGGTLTVNGTSTYTGATTISAGTLLLNGSLGNTALAVNSGGTLGGTNGTVGTGTASLNVNNGGTLAPGNSPGTLTINGTADLNSGSTYAYQYTGSATSADLLDVNGTLTIASGALLTLEDLGSYQIGDKFTLFAYETLSGSFDAYLNNQTYTLADGGEWAFNYNDSTAGYNGGTISGNAGSGFVTITAIPEPAAPGLIGAFGVVLLLRRRR